MTNLVIPANLQWIGAAKETTYGTAVAAPTFWIPVDGSSISYIPNINPLPDQAYRGLMGTDFQQVAGMRYDTLSYKTYPYMDSIFQHFLAILGRADAVTGSGDPYTHKTALENGVVQAQGQPPSYTLFYYDGLNCWQIPGCVESELKLGVKVDDITSLEASWMGMPAVLISPPTNTPSTNKPWQSWSSIISVAGSPVSTFSEVSIDYKRDVADVPTINNSQSPLQIFGGGVSVSINLTAVYQGGTNDAHMTAFLANTQAALSVKLMPAGDATHYLLARHTVFAYDASAPKGSKWMEVSATGKALMNATDALDSRQSPAQIQFLTSASAAY